jgi:hypothetical protein
MIPGTTDRKVFLIPEKAGSSGGVEVALVRDSEKGAWLERPGAAPEKLSSEEAGLAEDRFRETGRLLRRVVQARTRTAAALLLAHSRRHVASEELDWSLKEPSVTKPLPVRLTLLSRPDEDFYAAWCFPDDWLRSTAADARGEAPAREDETRRPMPGLLLSREGFRDLIAAALLLPDKSLDSFTAVWTY